MMMTKEDWVRRLGLEPHVEGAILNKRKKLQSV